MFRVIFSLCFALIISACASKKNQFSESDLINISNNDLQMTGESKNILFKNGFSNGEWSISCKDEKHQKIINFYDDKSKRIRVDVFDFGLLVKSEQIYDAEKIKDGLYRYKSIEVGKDGWWSHNSVVYGYISNKRMIFDAVKYFDRKPSIQYVKDGKELIFDDRGRLLFLKDSEKLVFCK